MKAKLVVLGIILGSVIGIAQGPLTPAPQLRVITDADGSLYVASATQTLPLSQPTPFNQIRLRTDSSGALLVTGITGFDPADSHDFTATQYFDMICFDTEASPKSCLEEDTSYSPPTGDTLALRRGTNRQTLRIYGTDTGVSGTSYALTLRAATGAGDAARIQMVDFNGTSTTAPLSIKAQNWITLGANSQDELGIFTDPASVGDDGVQTRAGGQYMWSSGGVDVVTQSDTGLARDAAGEVRVSNGTTGHGILDAASYKVNNTAGDTDTCAMGVDAITVVGGIITSITCTP